MLERCPYLSPERKKLFFEQDIKKEKLFNTKEMLIKKNVFSLGLTLLEAITLRSIRNLNDQEENVKRRFSLIKEERNDLDERFLIVISKMLY